MPRPPKLKSAYRVDVDDGSEIVFVHSKNELLRTEEYESVVRVPEYDSFAPLGYVPSQQLHNDGWWFYCSECETKVDSDLWDYDEDLEIHPIFKGARVYCCQSCYDAYSSRRQTRLGAIAALELKFPGIEDIFAWTSNHGVSAMFKFPGGISKAEWTSNDPDHVRIRQQDAENWERYRSRNRVRASQ